MGQEIAETLFSQDDFACFGRHLVDETGRARQAFADGQFADDGRVAGFELEAWLIDRNLFPVGCNQAFLARLNDPLVVPELSRFNIGVSTGQPEGPINRWTHPYRHWRFVPTEYEIDASRAKRK